MRHHILATALLTALLAAAAPGQAGAQTPSAGVVTLPFDSAAAATLSHRGRVVAGRRWRDATGTHTLLLTQTGKLPSHVPEADLLLDPADQPPHDAEVYAYHYTDAADSARLVWRTADFERGCQFDLYAGYLVDALTITDLDRDGVAETTVVYTLSCRSDVSPATRKLLMHEGAAKYAIRGTTRIPAEKVGGEMTLDPAFAGAPRAFRDYAVRQWRRYVAVEGVAQF